MLITAQLLNQDTIPTLSSTTSYISSPVVEEAEENEEETKGQHHQHIAINLVDVGIGCGDQSLYLTRQLFRRGRVSNIPPTVPPPGIEGPANHSNGTSTREAGKRRTWSSHQQSQSLFDSYVGINITQCQADFARERLLETSSTGESVHQSNWTPKVKVFAADAGNPASWERELRDAVFWDPSCDLSYGNFDAKTGMETRTWLLALDTLYHFKPSRSPLFACAYRDIQASIMAFDLLLSDSASFWDKLRLRLICLVTGIPYTNFVTRNEYEDMLVCAGYPRDLIEMEDISEHVFSGLATYISEHDRELRTYGMTVGKFKGPAKVFNWWATSGVVRGFVVVARRSRRPERK